MRFIKILTVFLFYIAGMALPAWASESPISIHNLPICMDFSCKHKQTISLGADEWKTVANWLKQDAPDAETERQNIKQAIGWMEVIVGRHTPTHRDVGGDLVNDEREAVFPGQLDCIDESLNTTTYLTLFEQNELLKYHRVLDRAYRRAIFDQHWAGQIQEIENGQRWVVDSWFQHNGYLPYIQQSEAWEDIPLFTSYLDSSQAKDDKPSLFRRLFN